MLNINEDDLKKAIIEKATDELLRDSDDLSAIVSSGVEQRLNKMFSERLNAQINAAIDSAITAGFAAEYQPVNSFGQPAGEKTTLAAQLERRVKDYWQQKVDRSGNPTNSDYNSVTRADFLMMQICAKDFTEKLKQDALNVTGALKDGLRNQLAAQMDSMLDGLEQAAA